MILVIILLVVSVTVMRQETAPFKAMVAQVRRAWLAGVDAGISVQEQYTGSSLDETWLRNALKTAQRRQPLDCRIMELVCSQLWDVDEDIVNKRAELAALRLRIYCVCLFVVIVRSYFNVVEFPAVLDVAGQLLGALISTATISATVRAMGNHWFWCNEFTEAGKTWMEGLLHDCHPDSEFVALKNSERLAGRNLRSVRLSWLSTQSLRSARADRLGASRSTLLIMMFDLLAIGPALVGGCGPIVIARLV